MKKMRSWIYNLILYLNAAVLFLMFVILLVQVFYRKFLNDPISWSEEIALITMIWITFVGAYQCTAEDSHLKMSFLEEKLPKYLSIGFNIFTKLVIITFLVIAAYAGIPLLEASISRSLPISGISMLVPYLIIWGSIVLMIFETLLQIFQQVKKMFNPVELNENPPTKGGSNL